MNKKYQLMIATCLLALSSHAGAAENFGNWVIRTIKDQMTDQVIVFAQTQESQRARGVSLMVACMKPDELRIVYNLGGYMGGAMINRNHYTVRVQYRMDERPASGVTNWRLVAPENTAAIITGTPAANFASLIKVGDKILMRVTDPLDEETRNYTFDLEGATAAFENLDCVKY